MIPLDSTDIAYGLGQILIMSYGWAKPDLMLTCCCVGNHSRTSLNYMNHRGKMYRQACPCCSRQHFQVNSNLESSSMQYKCKIISLKNVVCYKKDNPAGMQFLPSPCGNRICFMIMLCSYSHPMPSIHWSPHNHHSPIITSGITWLRIIFKVVLHMLLCRKSPKGIFELH